MAKLALEREKSQDTTQLNAMKIGAQIENDKHKLANQQQQVGLKAGMDMAKSKEQTDLQRKQAMLQHLQTFKKEPPKQ
jgi:hypothetical protein